MKAVSLTLAVESYPDTTIRIDPSSGFAVAARFDAGTVSPGLCEVFVPCGVFTIRGTVEEVSAALESTTAPPVAAAVEVAPDLERAAALLDLFAEDGIVWSRVDYVLGLSDAAGWDDSRNALRALAAKLRGGG